jgi:hypothetical protein
MRRIDVHRLGIDEGEELLFSDFENGGPMWTGEGFRRLDKVIAFGTPFLAPPTVRVWLTMWDIANTATSRVGISAKDIGCERFTLSFHTWGDTRIARVRAAWLALGPLRDDEDWQVD